MVASGCAVGGTRPPAYKSPALRYAAPHVGQPHLSLSQHAHQHMRPPVGTSTLNPSQPSFCPTNPNPAHLCASKHTLNQTLDRALKSVCPTPPTPSPTPCAPPPPPTQGRGRVPAARVLGRRHHAQRHAAGAGPGDARHTGGGHHGHHPGGRQRRCHGPHEVVAGAVQGGARVGVCVCMYECVCWVCVEHKANIGQEWGQGGGQPTLA